MAFEGEINIDVCVIIKFEIKNGNQYFTGNYKL